MTDVTQRVNDTNIPELLEWVGDDLDRAQEVLDAELATEKPRGGILGPLEAMLLEAQAQESDDAASEAADQDEGTKVGADEADEATQADQDQGVQDDQGSDHGHKSASQPRRRGIGFQR